MTSLEFTLFSAMRRLARTGWAEPVMNRLLQPFNPFDPARHVDPYPAYRAARQRAPVFYHRRIQVWVVTGHDEATEVLRGPVSVDRRPLFEAVTPYRNMRAENVDLLLSNILMLDPPDHTRLRALVSRAFSPRTVAALEPDIVELVTELITELSDEAREPAFDQPHRGVDVMDRFANRLPVNVISRMLGLPRERWDEARRLSYTVAQFVDPISPFDPDEMDAAIGRLRAIFTELIDQRRADPGDDLLSRLVEAQPFDAQHDGDQPFEAQPFDEQHDGDRLSEHELIAMLFLLYIGGHETTSGLIGNAIVAIDRQPEARRWLLDRSNEPAIETAVEELLRYDNPIQTTDRTALEAFEVGGVTIPAGAVILVLLGAANRDPAVYDEPDRLILDRQGIRPLSFGHGIHHCIGAALARLQARIAIPAFVAAFPNYRVDTDHLAWRRSTTIRGPASLPVELGGLDGPYERPVAALVGKRMTAATAVSTISPPTS